MFAHLTVQPALRDIHRAQAPSPWPPAPGWWLLMLCIAAACAGVIWWRRRRARRLAAIHALFDEAVRETDPPTAQVAAMSSLLRRAARRVDARGDVLEGDAWRALLNEGMEQRTFSGAVGDLLLEGGFRAQVPEAALRELRVAARARFLRWMAKR